MRETKGEKEEKGGRKKKNHPREREKEREGEKKCSLVKTNPFEQTVRSSGSNFPIMPSFDRVSRVVTVKKTRTHTEERKARRRGKKNSF